MNIDISKVNLTEKDIEDWLWENPAAIGTPDWYIVQWVARQLKVPSGILDLLGIDSDGDLCVVEVKNVNIDASALAQVMRYSADVISAIARNVRRSGRWSYPMVHTVCVGTGLGNQALHEARAMNVLALVFEANLKLTLHRRIWTGEYSQKIETCMEALSRSVEIEHALFLSSQIENTRDEEE